MTRREILVSLAHLAVGSSALRAPLAFAQVETPGQSSAGAIAALPNQTLPRSLLDYESLARERLSPAGWEYYSSGAADNITLRANREALERLYLNPRILVDVSKIDMRVKLFGQDMAHPILLAPTSTHLIAHPEGEVATARGASAAKATMVVSSYSNRSVEEIAKASAEPLWFQLYIQDDRGATKALIQRAEAAGCRTLCVTVDLARSMRATFGPAAASSPQYPFPHLNATGGPGAAGINKNRSGAFNWKDLEWILSFARTPVLLKGVVNPEDAELAINAGIAGIIVSNHGGRALDFMPATIDALPRAAARVGGRVPVLMDGGIRRGSDVLKALALGASAVMIGRPYLYGLTVGGPDGVSRVIEILRTELDFAMALTGRPSIGSLDPSVIWR